MSLRVRLVGIKPHNLMRTLHQCTTLSASELDHLLSKEQAHALFPKDAGVHFDFTDKNQITLHPQKHSKIHINGKKIQYGDLYTLIAGDAKILQTEHAEFRLNVLESHF